MILLNIEHQFIKKENRLKNKINLLIYIPCINFQVISPDRMSFLTLSCASIVLREGRSSAMT